MKHLLGFLFGLILGIGSAPGLSSGVWILLSSLLALLPKPFPDVLSFRADNRPGLILLLLISQLVYIVPSVLVFRKLYSNDRIAQGMIVGMILGSIAIFIVFALLIMFPLNFFPPSY